MNGKLFGYEAIPVTVSKNANNFIKEAHFGVFINAMLQVFQDKCILVSIAVKRQAVCFFLVHQSERLLCLLMLLPIVLKF